MANSFFAYSKPVHRTLAIFLVFALIFPVSSCNDSKEDKGYLDTDCMILTYTQVKDWADAGSLKGADSVKFFTSYLGPDPNVATDVAAYLSTNASINSNSGTMLERGTNCEVSLPPGIGIEMTQISLAALQILDNNGNLKLFKFIRLTPRSKSAGGRDYLAYEVTLTDATGTHALGWADPCPPLCP